MEVGTEVGRCQVEGTNREGSKHFKQHSQPFLKVEGTRIACRATWEERLRDFTQKRHRDPGNGTPAQNKRFRDLEGTMESERRDGRPVPQLSIDILMRVRATLRGAIAPGEDELTVEMLRRLPWTAFLAMQQAFQKRLQGEELAGHDSWKRLALRCIAKVSKAEEFKNFRFIALPSVLQKFYLACPVEWCRHTIALWRCNVIGFENGRSASGAAEPIRQLLDKARTWDVSLAVTGGDAERAFDSMVHADIAWALQEARADLTSQQHP